MGIELQEEDAAARERIVHAINELIVKDFEKLVSILYRIDVSEKKINQLLQEFPQQDAAGLIAELMIERETEKAKSRELYRGRNDDFTEEEKW